MTDTKMTGTKTCSKCEKDLPVIFFSVRRESYDGLNSQCRECVDKYNFKRYNRTHAEKRVRNAGIMLPHKRLQE